MLIDRIVDAATTRMITGMEKPVDGVLAVDMLIGPDLLQDSTPGEFAIKLAGRPVRAVGSQRSSQRGGKRVTLVAR